MRPRGGGGVFARNAVCAALASRPDQSGDGARDDRFTNVVKRKNETGRSRRLEQWRTIGFGRASEEPGRSLASKMMDEETKSLADETATVEADASPARTVSPADSKSAADMAATTANA